ncbi:MAG: hypothetical protein KDB48_10720 [Solirubrobacterales bacterium]|nr:hypothetical protein [Solirubrobacterales bacterium]HMT05387.1 hypothetical protein [Solirubrobacterales bacterium]
MSRTSITRITTSVVGVVLLAGALAGQASMTQAQPKKPAQFTLKNGFYSGGGNTGVIFTTSGHKISEVSVTMKFKFNGGGKCAPIGTALNIESNTAYFDVDRMKPVKPNRKNRFKIPISVKTSGLSLSSGSITGRLISARKMTVSVKFRQEANDFQGVCSSTLKVPSVTFVE